jgi:hypothetical protein
VNLGSAIKVTNDFIITQQGEHWYYMQRLQSLIEEIINIAKTTQYEDVPTLANLIREVM